LPPQHVGLRPLSAAALKHSVRILWHAPRARPRNCHDLRSLLPQCGHLSRGAGASGSISRQAPQALLPRYRIPRLHGSGDTNRARGGRSRLLPRITRRGDGTGQLTKDSQRRGAAVRAAKPALRFRAADACFGQEIGNSHRRTRRCFPRPQLYPQCLPYPQFSA